MRPVRRGAAIVAGAAFAMASLLSGLSEQSVAAAAPALCADRAVTAESLNAQFGDHVDGIVGADYQRAFELDDGRVLWVFQDAFVDDGAGEPTLVHNAAAIQDGMCFERLVGGTDQRPESWVASDRTDAFRHWYWPLGGHQVDTDTFVLYLAEMEERGDRYLANATPVATWTVTIDLETMSVGELAPAPDAGDELYGFDVVADEEHLYLYAQCHRQFGFSPIGHDECASRVYVARQPLDDPSLPLEYWDGSDWTLDSSAAANIAPLEGPDGELRIANPMQIERNGDEWIAVTKASDWWGDAVYFDVAPNPEGPWTTTAVMPVATPGESDEIASYFVSFVPTDDDQRTIAISYNRWDGVFSDVYHPSFTEVSDRLWAAREPQPITANVWLPIGPPLP